MNVIACRTLLTKLSDENLTLLMRQMDIGAYEQEQMRTHLEKLAETHDYPFSLFRDVIPEFPNEQTPEGACFHVFRIVNGSFLPYNSK